MFSNLAKSPLYNFLLIAMNTTEEKETKQKSSNYRKKQMAFNYWQISIVMKNNFWMDFCVFFSFDMGVFRPLYIEILKNVPFLCSLFQVAKYSRIYKCEISRFPSFGWMERKFIKSTAEWAGPVLFLFLCFLCKFEWVIIVDVLIHMLFVPFAESNPKSAKFYR